MIYVEAPNEEENLPINARSIFLAGGITNCPDWQDFVRASLISTPLVVYNPRRKDFPIDDPSATEQQIRWEHQKLMKAHAVLFWFSRGSQNPIVLFEYGKELGRHQKKLFVGVDPEYPRKQDVLIQTYMEHPNKKVYDNLPSLINQVFNWCGVGAENSSWQAYKE